MYTNGNEDEKKGKSMAYTSFGEFTRILRIRNHEVMGDMAKKLNVSVPFLSAVENGKKNVPEGWKKLLVQIYNLNQDEEIQLSNAIDESKTQIKIYLDRAGITQRQVALQFTRSFDEMDDDTAKKILELLRHKESK